MLPAYTTALRIKSAGWVVRKRPQAFFDRGCSFARMHELSHEQKSPRTPLLGCARAAPKDDAASKLEALLGGAAFYFTAGP